MSRIHSLRGLALALGVVGIANSCSVPYSDLIAPTATRGGMFDTYVAIGNSITAGYQSSGITDSTQKRSYAFLLAQAMGTRFAYPSMLNPGCPSLVNNFQTQARVSATPCSLRTAGTATDILNNVAVPGAWSNDPASLGTANSNSLTQFFLGGKSQVQKAMDAKPTFVSVWIGNNDLLGPGVSGGSCTTANAACALTLSAITTPAQFTINYDAIIDSVKKASPGVQGVLIGVVNVINAPVMFPVSTLTGVAKATFDAIACGAATSGCFGTGTVPIDASCTGSTALMNAFMVFQIRTGAHPAIIACTPGGASGLIPAPVGDILILTAAEQTTITTAVTAFNTYISGKATALGWAYYDPNTQLATLRTAGTVVRNTPTYGTTGTFGTGMSLDGVHPGAAVHLTIANDIIAAINAKYTSIKLPNAF